MAYVIQKKCCQLPKAGPLFPNTHTKNRHHHKRQELRQEVKILSSTLVVKRWFKSHFTEDVATFTVLRPNITFPFRPICVSHHLLANTGFGHLKVLHNRV